MGTYGPIDMQIGVESLGQLDISQATEIAHYFAGTRIYVKMVDPPLSLFSSPAFTLLSEKGFRWYLTFSTSAAAPSVLAAFATTGKTQEAVIELKEGALSSFASLKSQYPQFTFHGGEYAFWPREKVRDLLQASPQIDGISIYIEGPDGGLFAEARLMFDTFFDASKDIAGGSIKINYPPGKKLSLSSLRMKQKTPSGEAFAAAVVGDILTSSVQGGIAPFRFLNLGRFTQYSSSLKETFANLAKVVESKPTLIWPRAAGGNGNPYDNEYPGWENSNSKPVMGVILKGSTGLFSMIVNASGDPQDIVLNGTPVVLAAFEVHREGGSSIGPGPIVPTAIPSSPPAALPDTNPPDRDYVPIQVSVMPIEMPGIRPTDIPVIPVFPTTKPFRIPPPQETSPSSVYALTIQPVQTTLGLPSPENVIRHVQSVLEIPKQGIEKIYIWDKFLEIYVKIWMMNITAAFQK